MQVTAVEDDGCYEVEYIDDGNTEGGIESSELRCGDAHRAEEAREAKETQKVEPAHPFAALHAYVTPALHASCLYFQRIPAVLTPSSFRTHPPSCTFALPPHAAT